MGTQQQVLIEVEGIVHRPRRVMGGDVEGLEVVVVVLDLRALGDTEAGVGEQALDTQQGAGNRVQATAGLAASGQGNVHPLGLQPGLQGLALQRTAALVDPGLELLLGLVDGLPGLGTLFLGQLTQGLELLGQQTALAEKAHAHRIQGRQIGGRVDTGRRLGLQLLQLDRGVRTHGNFLAAMVEGPKKRGRPRPSPLCNAQGGAPSAPP